MSNEHAGAGTTSGGPVGGQRGTVSRNEGLIISGGSTVSGNISAGGHFVIGTPESIALAAGAAIYSKAFLETLGQRTGEGVANLSKYIELIVRDRMRKGKQDGYLIGIEGATAILVVTEDLPDEARLALLDLDVTAEDVRGKTLQWDTEAMAWVPTPPSTSSAPRPAPAAKLGSGVTSLLKSGSRSRQAS